MKLTDLEPQFLKIKDEKTFEHVDEISAADGVLFLCPKCFVHNDGPVGTHSVLCWCPHVPQSVPPVPGRWDFQGTCYGDLSLVAGSSSVLLKGFCVRPGCPGWHGWPEGGGPPCTDPRCAGWHGFIQNGEVTGS